MKLAVEDGIARLSVHIIYVGKRTLVKLGDLDSDWIARAAFTK